MVNFFGGLPNGADHIRIDTNRIHYHEIFLTGSHGSSPAHHREAVDLVLQGRIPVGKLISKVYPLLEFDRALKEAANKSNLKVMISPN